MLSQIPVCVREGCAIRLEPSQQVPSVIVRLGQDQVGGFGIRADTWSEFLRQVSAATLPASGQTQ